MDRGWEIEAKVVWVKYSANLRPNSQAARLLRRSRISGIPTAKVPGHGSAAHHVSRYRLVKFRDKQPVAQAAASPLPPEFIDLDSARGDKKRKQGAVGRKRRRFGGTRPPALPPVLSKSYCTPTRAACPRSYLGPKIERNTWQEIAANCNIWDRQFEVDVMTKV